MYVSTTKRFINYEIINRNHLKYIVILLMLLDHLSYFFPATNPIIIFIGFISRLTAPTMALSIAEGYHYTRDVKKYMSRLFIFAIISYVPYVLYRTAVLYPIQLFSGNLAPTFVRATGAIVAEPNVFISAINSILVIHETSVIFTLFLGLCAIYIWDKLEIPKILKVIAILMTFYLAAFANWHYILILLCLIFYFFKENPKKMWALYAIVSLLYIFNVRLFANPFQFAFTFDFELFRTGILMIPLFFLFYNGESGSKSSFNKWFFYIFYPAHLLIIGVIRLMM